MSLTANLQIAEIVLWRELCRFGEEVFEGSSEGFTFWLQTWLALCKVCELNTFAGAGSEEAFDECFG